VRDQIDFNRLGRYEQAGVGHISRATVVGADSFDRRKLTNLYFNLVSGWVIFPVARNPTLVFV